MEAPIVEQSKNPYCSTVRKGMIRMDEVSWQEKSISTSVHPDVADQTSGTHFRCGSSTATIAIPAVYHPERRAECTSDYLTVTG
jgi:hypothetical protein